MKPSKLRVEYVHAAHVPEPMLSTGMALGDDTASVFCDMLAFWVTAPHTPLSTT